MDSVNEDWQDWAQAGLDVVGLIPGAGEVADLANAVWYAKRGMYLYALLSLISTVPVVGDAVGKGGKAALFIAKSLRKLRAAGKAGKAAARGLRTSRTLAVDASKVVRDLQRLLNANRPVIEAALKKAEGDKHLGPYIPKLRTAFHIFLKDHVTAECVPARFCALLKD